jgi:hemerythrin-like domain-containing protein
VSKLKNVGGLKAMNHSTRRLVDEHVLICIGLDICDKAASMVMSGSNVPNSIWENLIDFTKEYTDGFHHAKEEGVLFPLLCQRGLSLEYGPIAVMLHDHETFRRLLGQMNEGLEENNMAKVIAAYNEYSSSLRMHIHKENNILYPMGESMISREDEENLNSIYDETEMSLGGEKTSSKYHNMILSMREVVDSIE